jgi:hypothetical protein
VRARGRRTGSGKGVAFLARWPTDQAMQRARDRIRELTGRRRVGLRVEVIVAEINRFLRGWAAYFRYGNSAGRFNKIMRYARLRVAIFLANKHQRSRGFGFVVIVTAAGGGDPEDFTPSTPQLLTVATEACPAQPRAPTATCRAGRSHRPDGAPSTRGHRPGHARSRGATT